LVWKLKTKFVIKKSLGTDLKLIMDLSYYNFYHLKLDYYYINIHILVTNPYARNS